ncbi:GRAM domain-containing protein 2B-like [Bacillus rossius redtenbacheri]|uniref:GRAM domain-containing protein 2B-like n=1 Tax=Bacillus rossius redtenbacheri TaxID=93214 RepID=UPI002FDD5D73
MAGLRDGEHGGGSTPVAQRSLTPPLPRGARRRDVKEMLAWQLLQLSVPVVTPPAPVVVQDPPSSGDEQAEPRVVIDTSFLDGSSSSALAHSAPSSPQEEPSGGRPGAAAPAAPAAPAPGTTPLQAGSPMSPSGAGQHVFNRHDRQALKQLSVSAPAMTQAQACVRQQSAGVEPGSSKYRQKKFHRHFKQVAAEERVLNYYSCALVGDILLQGHLYITKNYFAFYSNVFGYITKVLIPTVSVLKISKEKTARIIPNAVGVATEDEKHVFGSLLSRDSTYRFMVQVWKAAVNAGPEIALPSKEMDSVSGDIPLNDDDDDSSTGSEHSCPPTPLEIATEISHSESCAPKLPLGRVVAGHTLLRPPQVAAPGGQGAEPAVARPTLLLLVSTALLVLLFLSAALLLYRIGRIHHQFAASTFHGKGDVYQEILRWQTQLHTKSASEVQEFLSSHLDQLAKVRRSLEALSILIVAEEEASRSQRASSDALLQDGNS